MVSSSDVNGDSASSLFSSFNKNGGATGAGAGAGVAASSERTNDSTMSWRSFTSTSDDGMGGDVSQPIKTSSSRSPNNSSHKSSVHGNLMRSRRQRDPKRYYRVVQVLGEGSMVRIPNDDRNNHRNSVSTPVH